MSGGLEACSAGAVALLRRRSEEPVGTGNYTHRLAIHVQHLVGGGAYERHCREGRGLHACGEQARRRDGQQLLLTAGWLTD